MKKVFITLIFLCATAAMTAAFVWFVHETGCWNWASAFCISWFVLAWVATLYLLTHFRFPEWYYRPANFEKSGRVYELSGVRLFRKLVRRGPLHILAPAMEYTGQRAYLPSLEQETRIAESIHLIAFFATLLLIVFAMIKGRLGSAGWLLLFNVLLNVYPMALQRYNRIHLKKLLS
jgi:hypothetical protein